MGLSTTPSLKSNSAVVTSSATKTKSIHHQQQSSPQVANNHHNHHHQIEGGLPPTPPPITNGCSSVAATGQHKLSNSNQIGRNIVNNARKLTSNEKTAVNEAVVAAATTATKSVAANFPPFIDPSDVSVEALGVLIQYLVFHVSLFNNFLFRK